MQTTLLGAALLLLIVWLFYRHRSKSEEKQQPTSLKDTGNTAYHAVSIKLDGNACEAAKAMEGRRFLATAAPRLPLPECNGLECRCHFIHHQDRRLRTLVVAVELFERHRRRLQRGEDIRDPLMDLVDAINETTSGPAAKSTATTTHWCSTPTTPSI